MKKESFATGVAFMLLSAAGFSITGLLGKIGGQYLSLTALLFWRYFAAFILCFSLLWAIGKLKLGSPNYRMHVLRAVFVLSAQYSFFYYVQKSSLLNAMVLLNTGPLFIPLIERFVLRNPVGKSSWIGLAVSFLGVVCILQPDKGIFSFVSLIGLLSGLSQGASQVVFGINSKTERSDISVLILFFFCALFSAFPYLIEDSTWISSSEHLTPVLLLILGLGVMSICVQLSRAVAYQHSTPSRLASFLYFAVLLAGFLDWAVFNKIPNALSILGAALVILGGILKIYFRAVFQKRSKSP